MCRDTFVFLHTMSIARLKSIKQHWLENGLCPRGRPKVLPHNTTKLSDIKNVVRYILQYAEHHAILLPGRIPGYKRDDLQLLPSSTTKRDVWHLYHSAASTGADTKAVGYSLLRSLEEANSTGDCHPPHDRPLLGLPPGWYKKIPSLPLRAGPSRGSLPQGDCHGGGDAVLAVGCVVTITGGQTSPNNSERALSSEESTSTRGYDSTAARVQGMQCALTPSKGAHSASKPNE